MDVHCIACDVAIGADADGLTYPHCEACAQFALQAQVNFEGVVKLLRLCRDFDARVLD